MNLRYKLIGFSAPILALSLSVFITSLILTAIGKDPIETFILMYDYGTTGKSLVSVFNRFIPLYISAIAVAVGFKMGLFNIGVEGQYNFRISILFFDLENHSWIQPQNYWSKSNSSKV